MKINAKLLVGINLLLVLLVGIWQVRQKEAILEEGALLLLRLAPKDPLSIMQGYYMDLRYTEAQTLRHDSIPSKGYIVFEADSANVGAYRYVTTSLDTLKDSHIAVKYFFNGRFVSIGAESFFFEENMAPCYEPTALYGGLRVDRKGNTVLSGLYDQNYELLSSSDSCYTAEP